MAAGLLDVRDGQDGQIVLPDDITLRVGAENLNQEYRFIHAFNIPLHLFVLQQNIERSFFRVQLPLSGKSVFCALRDVHRAA